MELEHDDVRVVRGRRSGPPVIIAVHSAALGQAIGSTVIEPLPGPRQP